MILELGFRGWVEGCKPVIDKQIQYSVISSVLFIEAHTKPDRQRRNSVLDWIKFYIIRKELEVDKWILFKF